MTGMIIGILSGDEDISAYKLKRLRRREKTITWDGWNTTKIINFDIIHFEVFSTKLFDIKLQVFKVI